MDQVSFSEEYESTASYRGLIVDLVFIVSTDKQKADAETRKLIRSRVMRGKNRIKPRKKPQGSLHGDSQKVESLLSNGAVEPLSISRIMCSKFSSISFADTVEPARIEDVLFCEQFNPC
jgi:hypothetical protein